MTTKMETPDGRLKRAIIWFCTTPSVSAFLAGCAFVQTLRSSTLQVAVIYACCTVLWVADAIQRHRRQADERELHDDRKAIEIEIRVLHEMAVRAARMNLHHHNELAN